MFLNSLQRFFYNLGISFPTLIFQETSTCLFLKSETMKILVLFQMISQKKFLDEMEKEREKGNRGRKKKGTSRAENNNISDDNYNERGRR